MGFLKKFSSFVRGVSQATTNVDSANSQAIRQCRFETLESRLVLTADPVIAGVTFLEADAGQDTAPDQFEVTFEGGAATTQLTQFVINGDQDGNAMLSDGDVFFDVADGFPGTGGNAGFVVDVAASRGIGADDILGVNVSEDGLMLTVDVQNFEAGDLLVFTIDVDEVENLNVDQIASGVEFEGSQFSTTFTDENYFFVDQSLAVDVELPSGFTQTQVDGIFFDSFDPLLEQAENFGGSTLDLEQDNESGLADRTAAAFEAFELTPRPISVSGTVFEDLNLNWEQDSNESGISGVQIDLQQFNADTGQYETVATTLTDANGNYEFGADQNLFPGDFRLVQIQPDGFLDVGASAGQVDGIETGTVAADASGQENIITDISIPLGNTAATDFDFKEIRPASISGHVFHDRNDDGNRDSGEEGIANVLIQVNRISASDGATMDPFANTPPVFVRTDANGFYQADGLPPGIYEVIEVGSFPGEADPLVGFIDGQDSLGQIDGETRGQLSNDQFAAVQLNAGDAGVNFDFGELQPVSLSGFVSISTPDGDCLDPNDPAHAGIAGVTIQLLDADGQLVSESVTDADGFYQFADLAPGTYSIVQIQPDGFLDGGVHLGNVDGVENGLVLTDNRFDQIMLTSGDVGQSYNFCEHIPAELHGTVFHDFNDNGLIDQGDVGIGGVTIELLDSNDSVIATTTTDAQGQYWFSNLEAGTYSIREIQPFIFADGIDSLGTVDGQSVGTASDDLFTGIELGFGQVGTEFNFGEIQLGSISGMVHGDANGDCNFNGADGDEPLAGVVLQLFDADGNQIAETVTDENGEYTFDNLRPGEYSIRQFTPDGFIDGEDFLGTIDNQTVGTVSDDLFESIVLSSGDQAVDFNFCEHIPAEIHGRVFHDLNNDGLIQDGDVGIANVVIQLFDADGELVAETVTDATGNYWFNDLIAGQYTISQQQPSGFLDGIDSAGQIDGVTVGNAGNDIISNIQINGGQAGIDFNFGEIQAASISGFVHSDVNANGIFDQNSVDQPLANVTLELLDADGQVIATTVTASDGSYQFENLLPGEYSVRQQQPENFFDGEVAIGDGGGERVNANFVSGIVLASGQSLAGYDFCEHPGAEIHGQVFVDGPAFETESGELPENFRDLRDGVFQAGVDTPLAGVRVNLYFFNLAVGDSLVTRPVTLGDVLPGFYPELGDDPNTPISVLTDENGEYWFAGLPAGNFVVLQEQPEGFIDANDIPGTTTGDAINSPADTIPESLLQFSGPQLSDALFGVSVGIGQSSFQNNFTEVSVLPVVSDDPPGVDIPPPLVPDLTMRGNPTPPGAGIAGQPVLFGALPAFQTEILTVDSVRFSAAENYTWHLSVVNAGQPRSEIADAEVADAVWQQVSFINDGDWQRFDMNAVEWIFTETKTAGEITLNSNTARFGMIDGIPLAGDFDGDGNDELAVFHSGYWMIDLNHNGLWDENDLLATLGEQGDRPVVGDWDGDGKDDIGIYGPSWERDTDAISNEPGLPNPGNHSPTMPKNLPPTMEVAADGARVMKLTSYGRPRVDVVDHVFGVGDGEDTPITGDWNGNGIRSIGYFNNGSWQFDVNGDGRFGFEDSSATFGTVGDIPLVGDFNGDGIEEIAVYRSGTWLIDTNGNLELDAADKTFQLGGADDVPVVGDFDGDGIDEPALYRRSTGGGLQ